MAVAHHVPCCPRCRQPMEVESTSMRIDGSAQTGLDNQKIGPGKVCDTSQALEVASSVDVEIVNETEGYVVQDSSKIAHAKLDGWRNHDLKVAEQTEPVSKSLIAGAVSETAGAVSETARAATPAAHDNKSTGETTSTGSEISPDTYKLSDLRKVAADHQWHLYEYGNGLPFAEALCLRKDGRMLGMDAQQYLEWQRSETGRGRLLDMAAARAQQIEREAWIPRDKTSAGSNEEILPPVEEDRPSKGKATAAADPEHTKRPNLEQSHSPPTSVQTEQSIAQPYTMKPEPHDIGQAGIQKHGEAFREEKVIVKNPFEAKQESYREKSGETHDSIARAIVPNQGVFSAHDKKAQDSPPLQPAKSQAKPKLPFCPPCYCNTCSVLMWRPGGFTEVLDHQTVSGNVQKWVAWSLNARQSIISSLKTHSKHVRRRWEKKSPAQRREILNKVYPGLPTYAALSRAIGDYWPRQKSRNIVKKGKKCQCSDCKVPESPASDNFQSAGFLTATISLDELVSDPDHLFMHLCMRAQHHPADHFLADLKFVEGARQVAKHPLRPYVFGTFNVTIGRYGLWQPWSDEAVHSFEAVAAPCSMYVFQAQSHTLSVLANTLSHLVSELPMTNASAESAGDFLNLQLAPSLRIPTLADLGSPFIGLSRCTARLEDAAQLLHDNFLKSVEELSSLRSDNGVFVERFKSCLDFSQAIDVQESARHMLVPHHLLVRPLERVVAWLNMQMLFSRVVEPRNVPSDHRSPYTDAFKDLLFMLEERYLQIRYELTVLLKSPLKASAIIPKAFLENHVKSISPISWLEVYFLNHPLHQARPLKLAFMQKCFNLQHEDTALVNTLVCEAIEEASCIARLVEILLAHEPMISTHKAEMVIEPRIMWFEMSRILLPDDCVQLMQERGASLQDTLRSVNDYTLPSGEHDLRWFEKHGYARGCLKKTWTAFEEKTIHYYRSKGFPVAWLEMVKKVMEATKPETEPRASTPRQQQHADTEFRVREESCEGSQIPHHSGPDTPTTRKLTNKKRYELNPRPESDSEASDDETSSGLRTSSSTPEIVSRAVRISIKRRYLPIVDSLFSNAQEQVSSVRWDRFERFMADAGLKVENGEGVAVVFSGRNVIDGRNMSLVLHRPHPDPVLYAVHMRNDTRKIVDCFGWAKEMFVARN